MKIQLIMTFLYLLQNALHMISISEIYIYSDQPTTCPNCGLRTEIILDLSHTKDQTQIHKCDSAGCNFEFVVQNDIDFTK